METKKTKKSSTISFSANICVCVCIDSFIVVVDVVDVYFIYQVKLERAICNTKQKWKTMT